MSFVKLIFFLPVLVLLLATRFFGSCIPSRIGDMASLAIALVLAVVAVLVEYNRPSNVVDPEWGSRNSFGMPRGLSYFPGMRAVLRVITAPLLGYFIFSQSLPWLYNMKFGQQGSQIETVSGFSLRYGFSCPQFDQVLFIYSRFLCTRAQSLTNGQRVTLEGLSSAWGINVERIVPMSTSGQLNLINTRLSASGSQSPASPVRKVGDHD